jgi:phosphoenolpyruvate synthase/pyruvate phosphate dikinase
LLIDSVAYQHILKEQEEKDKEIEQLKQRDSMNTDAISSLSDKVQQLLTKMKELEDRQR